MKVHYVKLGFLALLFFCIYSTVIVGQAEVVWSDDFNDGDYDGWTPAWGNWSTEKNRLQVSGYDDGMIFHNSTVSTGTWSFDVYLLPNKKLFFMFICNDFIHNEYANHYNLWIIPTQSSTEFVFDTVRGEYPEAHETLAVHTASADLTHRWHHIDITRDFDGRFRFYLDSTLIIDVTDDSLFSSEEIRVYSYGDGSMIDNIVVKDAVDPPQIQEWSDDFDDGDYEGWTVEWGNWYAENGTLQAIYHPDTTYNGGLILYPSTIAYGTWSFDVYLERNKIIFFGLATTDVVWDEFSNSYYFEIKPYAKTEFVLIKCLGDITTNQGLVWYTADSELSGWNHIDVTRDVSGRFSIYLNGELIIYLTDRSLNSSEHFFVCSYPDGPKVDNITVSNTIDMFHPIPVGVAVEVSQEEITQGEDVLVTIEVKDDYGILISDVSVDVVVDETIIDVSEVSWGVYQAVVDTSEYLGRVKLIVTAEKNGFISSESAHHFEVVAPASFAVSGLTLQPSVVERGKQAAVTVEVENVGGQEGSYQLLVDIEGVVREEITVTLDPGASKTVFYEFFASKAGTLTVNIGGLTDTLTVLEPASFEVSNLSIEPDSVREGEPVSITVECSNAGGVSGSYDVVLKLDGETEDTKSVTVDAGESTTVTFQVLTSESGTYLVEVHGLTGSYEVSRPGIPGYPIESVMLGLIAGLIIIWILIRNQTITLSPYR